MDAEWFDEFSVNIAEMDGQHVKIFAMIGKLRRGMEENEERQVVDEVLDELMEYTQTHFATEERLMRENEYPEVDKHVAEHAWLLAEVLDRRSGSKLGSPTKATELGAFLYSWLKDHIAGTDKQYSPFLNSKGVR